MSLVSFKFWSLDATRLDLLVDFIKNGLYRFCSFKSDFHLDMDTGFYVNLWVDELDEDLIIILQN